MGTGDSDNGPSDLRDDGYMGEVLLIQNEKICSTAGGPQLDGDNKLFGNGELSMAQSTGIELLGASIFKII